MSLWMDYNTVHFLHGVILNNFVSFNLFTLEENVYAEVFLVMLFIFHWNENIFWYLRILIDIVD